MSGRKFYNQELEKIKDRYFETKIGYIKVDGVWKTSKNKKAILFRDNDYTKTFKNFWKNELINNNTSIFYDDTKIYNPSTKKFVNKKSFITQTGNLRQKTKNKGLDVYNNKVVNSSKYITETLQPQLQNALNTNIKTTIQIKKGAIGNIKNLLNILPFGAKKMYFILGDGSYYFLNTENIKKISLIENQLTKGKKEIGNIVDLGKSDAEYVATIIDVDKNIELVIDNFNNPVIGAEYFPYTHNLNLINLERQQIYNKLDDYTAKELHKNNCLLHAIKNAGFDISQLRQFVKNQNVPMRSLSEIANIIKAYITVNRIEDTKNLRKFGNPYHPKIDLGLIKNHYFLIEPTIYTSYSIKNYFNLDKDNIKEWNFIYMIQQEKYYKRNKNKIISTYDLIKLLIENKETHLNDLNITNSIFHTKYYDKINIYDNLNYDNSYYHYENNQNGNLKENILRLLPSENDEIFCDGVIFFDFETTTRRNDGEKTIHKPYLVNTDYNKEGWIGEDCGLQLLNDLVEKYGVSCDDKEKINQIDHYKRTIKLIAHNSGYDFRFLQQYLYKLKTLEKGNGLFTANGVFYSNHKGYYDYSKKPPIWVNPPKNKVIGIEIIDSLKMINMGLGKFNKAFNLGETQKEILPYDLYSEENVIIKNIPLNECLKYVKENEHEEYKNNCIKWGCLNDDKVDIIKYSSNYCFMDCITLKEGYYKFRKMTLDACNLDIFDFVSLASLADYYLKKNGCYDGVVQLSGVPRSFIQECIVGGRTMTRRNQKYMSVADKKKYMKLKNDNNMTKKQKEHIYNMKLADFDSVSEYPSAMNRMAGFLKGTPKIIESWTDTGIRKDKKGNKIEPKIDLRYDGYFIKIKILSIGKKYDFPLISFKDKNNIRQFTNDVIGREVYVDKTMLEDYITYHEITYQFIQGYYYDEGRNNKINEVIKYLFEQRLYYKDLENPIQMIFKELMNSSYGKSYLKPIDTETKYIKQKDANKFIDRNFNYIKEFTELPNGNFKAKIIKTINNHFNNVHVGVEILSMSKRIMNEVMTTAEDNNIDMFITDTDSIHMDFNKINLIATKFKKKYNRELIGRNMGQFHVDFELKGAKDEENIYAIKSVFLGKKCYYDLLYTKNPDGTELYDEHIRMKGITPDAIKHRTKEGIYEENIILIDEDDNPIKMYLNEDEWKKSPNYKFENKTYDYFEQQGKKIKDFNNDIFELYKYLYEGNEVSFDLLAGNKVKFEYLKNGTIRTRDKFIRKIKFEDKILRGF